MANVNAPAGLVAKTHLLGIPSQTREYVIPASDGTATFVGDCVKSGGDADSTEPNAATVIQCGAATAIRGVIAGIVPRIDSLSALHRPASTRVLINVHDDPLMLFSVQSNNSATISSADIGLNADIAVGSGSTVTGASATVLNSTGKATTATLQLKILGLINDPANAFGDYNRLLVKINNHELNAGTGTAGV